MKYRTDYVTNSSSTSYVTVTINFVNGESAKIDLDNDDYPDCESLFPSATFLKTIKSVDKLAAYLISAFDYNLYNPWELATPETGEKLVSRIENLAIYLDKDSTGNKARFIKACQKNAKSIEDISSITIHESVSIYSTGDNCIAVEATERIIKEHGMLSAGDTAIIANIISEAMYNGDRPSVVNVYTYDFVNNLYEQKTDAYINYDWDIEKPIVRVDIPKRFYSLFNSSTGEYFRSNVFKDGKDTGVDPFMASFPHLIDVGIMGHCTHGLSGHCHAGCYQNGPALTQPNMTVADFEHIAKQCEGKVDQFALGGRGDPDMHENFGEILGICYEYGIVPNFTTSGYGLTEETAYSCLRCGAVAVSWYRQDYTLDAINLLLNLREYYNYNPKVNVHYVLNAHTIDEAVQRLEHDDFPKGLNAVIFLLHKPIGFGKPEDVLHISDSRTARFFELVNKGLTSFKIGFDSCTTPGILNHCNSIALQSIDTCEGGRFSCYIGSDMQMLPCSFDQQYKYAVSLRDHTIKQAWNSQPFTKFRSQLKHACPKCSSRIMCMGGCPLLSEIVLCDRHERSIPSEI